MSYAYQQANISRGGIPPSRKQEINNKIEQVMQLCRDENEAVTRDLGALIQAEKGVQDLLQTHT